MNERMASKRILITNIVSLNPGDAAILWGMLEILRQRYGRDTRFVFFDRAAGAASRYYPWATFRQALFGGKARGKLARSLESLGYGHWNLRLRYWLLRGAALCCRFKMAWIARACLEKKDYESVREYVDADLVISSGGTYLIENYGLWASIYDYRLTFAAGSPLLFFTQTLGPFRRPKYRAAFTQIFNRATGIFLRDERSRDNVLELGISPEKITLGKDAAFVIRPPEPARKGIKDRKDPLRIAVSARSLHFFNDEDGPIEETYKECVAALISLAVREFGAEVTFLSTCQGIPEYWTDDSQLAVEIYETLPMDIRLGVDIDGNFRQPLEIVGAYQKFDLVIATRMHAAILGLVAGAPVLAIAYEFKLEELFHQLGMNNAWLSTRDMSVAVSEQCLRSMLNNLESWRKHASGVQKCCRDQAMSVIGKLPSV